MGIRQKSREQILVESFKNFQITDILAFGKILGVEEQEDFIEFLSDIVEKFGELEVSKQKKLLRLAKDIGTFNKEEKNTIGKNLGIF